MKTEYELRVLEIEPKSIINRLEELGANKIGDFEQKRYVYNLNPAQDCTEVCGRISLFFLSKRN